MATEKKSELVSSPATVADAAVTSKLPEMNPLNEAEQIPPVNGATTNQQQVPLASLQKKKARTVKNKTAPNGHPMTEGRGQLAGKQSKKSSVKPAESTASEKLASQNPALKKQPKKVSGEIKATKSAKKSRKEVPAQEVVKIILQLRFHTIPGQRLFITGNHELFGNNDIERALPMEFFNQEAWRAEMLLDPLQLPDQAIAYNYVLKNADGTLSYDWGSDKRLQLKNQKSGELLIIDSWNHAGFYENVFYTEPFTNVLLKENFTTVKATAPKTVTHIFKVKAPLLKKNQAVAISGNCKAFGDWNPASAAVMSRTAGEDFWFLKVNLSRAVFPLVYKYCVYDVSEEKLIRYEDGNNRVLYDTAQKNRQTILNDGFVILPNNTWKGAGVAIPVFSLRSRNSFGAGEFHDLKLLVDWAKKTGLRLIQILPVNDTTATNTWLDSYPYAAISAFALHPMYLNLDGMVSKENQHLLEESSAERNRLNQLPEIDYTAVNHLKWKIIRQVYPSQKEKVFASKAYQEFFENNQHWLIPYAAFCFLKDTYQTADFNCWPQNKNYQTADIVSLIRDPANKESIAIHYFVQYFLHLQLKEATEYAHRNGIILKGDIPIGVYRFGADAWRQQELYNMNVQAGAPPDDFAVKGQNWGFPTYNWKRMKEDGFTWWKQRFAQMSYYFDAFRIDHILGFFRIWSIPVRSVEGIMGHFDPAIPVHIREFHDRGIWFDYNRYCRPYITDQVLGEIFGDQQDAVKKYFLTPPDGGSYQLKPEFATQELVKNYFDHQEDSQHNRWLKQSLFNLISNVILFEVEGSSGQQFHFRFSMEETQSYKQLDQGTRYQLKELYINYYFRRQDGFWQHEAMQKLPALKRVTNMLVCGEDLGLVPGCVPDVMKELGILSLEIQRMPKDPKREFFHPNDAPYLSVVTPSTHDMSTIRGWWEEDRNRTQHFFNDELGQAGNAPHFCEDWINKAIVLQHLYSPAIWSIFQLQDLLGISKKIRRENPHEERINVPSIPHYYWRYRMHLTLEDLLGEKEFNTDLKNYISASGR